MLLDRAGRVAYKSARTPAPRAGSSFFGTRIMTRRCELSGKSVQVGNIVSHANNKTHTKSQPNLQKVRAVFEGKVQKISVCTRCLRSGKVIKAA